MSEGKTRLLFFQHDDNWQDIKNATMNTIGKTKGAYPDSAWKRSLILAEHSPIRKLKFSWRWNNLPYWVSVHFVRHKVGIEHFVKTQRTDRTGTDRADLPQGSPVNHECEADAQALITISRKRLCNCASPETRAAWQRLERTARETEESDGEEREGYTPPPRTQRASQWLEIAASGAIIVMCAAAALAFLGLV